VISGFCFSYRADMSCERSIENDLKVKASHERSIENESESQPLMWSGQVLRWRDQIITASVELEYSIIELLITRCHVTRLLILLTFFAFSFPIGLF
jgi:hypothetical protein